MTSFNFEIPAQKIELNSGYSIPQLGYGLYKVPEENAEDLVQNALDTGFRHLDSAAFYKNEQGVGRALSQAFEGGLDRENLFITSKVWNTEQGYEKTLASFKKTLNDLRLDYLDLFLIHWPCPERNLYLETWRALEELKDEGKIRSIGVSNFRVQDLENLLEKSETIPAVNQIECHPWLQQTELRAFHAEHGIATEAWSPLARGALLDDATLVDLASSYQVTVAQLVLRWHLQSGIITFPKASSRARMEENADVFNFEITEADMQKIAVANRDFRSGSHPDVVN